MNAHMTVIYVNLGNFHWLWIAYQSHFKTSWGIFILIENEWKLIQTFEEFSSFSKRQTGTGCVVFILYFCERNVFTCPVAIFIWLFSLIEIYLKKFLSSKGDFLTASKTYPEAHF